MTLEFPGTVKRHELDAFLQELLWESDSYVQVIRLKVRDISLHLKDRLCIGIKVKMNHLVTSSKWPRRYGGGKVLLAEMTHLLDLYVDGKPLSQGCGRFTTLPLPHCPSPAHRRSVQLAV